MITQNKTNVRRKRRRGSQREDTVYYVLEIKDWEWSFSFGVNPTKYGDGPYSDYRHLQLRGNLLRPTKVKALDVDWTFLPDRELNEDKRARHEPNAVGSLQLHRGHLTGLLSIPSDALPSVLQMVIAGRFKFVVAHGDRLRYGRAAIRHYRLEMTIRDDDLPLEA